MCVPACAAILRFASTTTNERDATTNDDVDRVDGDDTTRQNDFNISVDDCTGSPVGTDDIVRVRCGRVER